VELALGAFGRSGIEAHAGADVPGAVKAALLHYAAQLESGRAAIRFPRFSILAGAGRPALILNLRVDSTTRAVFMNEAERQGVPTERLMEHAVMVYLADLCTGAGAGVDPPGSPRDPGSGLPDLRV